MVSVKVFVVFCLIASCLVVVAQADFGPKCPIKEEFKDKLKPIQEKCSAVPKDEHCLCVAKASGIVSENGNSFSVDEAVKSLNMLNVNEETLKALQDAIRGCGSASTNVDQFMKCTKEASTKICK